VRQTIAAYLLALARMDVVGFRIDAAKHIQQVELDSILALVNRAAVMDGRPLPYVFLEVIGGAGEALSPHDYWGEGYDSGGAADITEFIFRGVGDKFTKLGGQKIADLDPNGPAGAQFSPTAWGMMPADKAVVFLENHDTQRSGGLGWRDGAVYQLANVWMLAQPYGYPSIMSSYAFDPTTQLGREMGPPSDASGATKTVTCPATPGTTSIASGEWVCEHRIPAILRMVGFRRYVAGTDVNHWWSNGGNAIAFSRGAKGFVALNRETATVSATVGTGLAAGNYCDLLTGGRSGASCVGTTVTVAADGSVQLNLASNTAIAIDGATKL